MSTVIYEPKPEKWYQVYYPGLPYGPATEDELVQLAQIHQYDIEFVRGLYKNRKDKEKVKDASNPSS
jgi:hypothetical protein